VGAILIAALNIYIAWRYSGQLIGPDEGIWLLTGITGAKYGCDYVDCKPPGIHFYMWLLAKLTGRRVPIMKFLHHAIIGAIAVCVYYLTGSLSSGLMATALLQSAWFLAYQSWVDALGSAFLLLGVLLPPYPALVCFAIATLFNIKMAVPALVWGITQHWFVEMAIVILGGLFVLNAIYIYRPAWIDTTVYQAVTVAARLTTYRKQIFQNTFNSTWAVSMLLVIPTLLAAVQARTSIALWVVFAVYALLNAAGRTWRPNHWLPLSLMAAAAPPLTWSVLILLMEWISTRAYWGNIWLTTYPGIVQELLEAKAIGEVLRDKPGTLWVNTLHTQIYIYAQKKPMYNMVQQVEIADVIPERAAQRDQALRKLAPTIIVLGPLSVPAREIQGYRLLSQTTHFAVVG
jgi:hypothetical protein